MSLLSYSKSYVPIYLDLVEIAKKHEKVAWHEDEVNLDTDMKQWRIPKELSEEDKNLIRNILRLFTSSDVAVGQAYYEKLIPMIKNNEARNMLGSFAAREGIHQRAYALLSDTLGFGESFYFEFLEYQEMNEKFEFMNEDIGWSLAEFGIYLAKQIMIEGVSLFASFAMLLNFDRRGKLPGMCDVVRWSSIDETLHLEGNSLLFRIFLDENPEIVNDDFKAEIYSTAEKLVELEDAFIDKAFELGGVDGLEANQVKEYIRYVTNYRLNQLGLKKIWNIDKHPLPWVDENMQSGHANFFERPPTSYAKANLSGSFGGAYDRRDT